MKLFWSPRSPFVRKVMVCAHELGIVGRIEKVYALVSMSNANADVLKVNPVGRIPALIADDGTVHYDSHVICEYLDARFGGERLFPRDETRRWEALRRLALGDGALETLVLWRSEQTRPEDKRSPAVLETFQIKATSALAAIELEVDTLKHDSIDIGEIAIGCVLGYLDFRFAQLEWRSHYPHAAEWFARFNERPSMVETRPYEE